MSGSWKLKQESKKWIDAELTIEWKLEQSWHVAASLNAEADGSDRSPSALIGI